MRYAQLVDGQSPSTVTFYLSLCQITVVEAVTLALKEY
jgi:hypothetical protein